MPVPRQALVDFLDALLAPPAGCHDPSNNGLQVEGRSSVRRVAMGVDACLALFTQAAAAGADFVIVHHGLSWGGGIRRLTGTAGARVRALMRHGLSLYASHLPLDAHPRLGHNAVIARGLGLRTRRPWFEYEGACIGCRGDLPAPATPAALAARLGRLLGATVEHVGAGAARIRRVGVVSGGGGDAIETAARDGLHCLVTGELGHSDIHVAREAGLHVLAAGHYRSEIPGLLALGDRIRRRFRIPCDFFDLPTGR
jgi:dinuclear metal center YbgI/SA1388 family protein